MNNIISEFYKININTFNEYVTSIYVSDLYNHDKIIQIEINDVTKYLTNNNIIIMVTNNKSNKIFINRLSTKQQAFSFLKNNRIIDYLKTYDKVLFTIQSLHNYKVSSLVKLINKIESTEIHTSTVDRLFKTDNIDHINMLTNKVVFIDENLTYPNDIDKILLSSIDARKLSDLKSKESMKRVISNKYKICKRNKYYSVRNIYSALKYKTISDEDKIIIHNRINKSKATSLTIDEYTNKIANDYNIIELVKQLKLYGINSVYDLISFFDLNKKSSHLFSIDKIIENKYNSINKLIEVYDILNKNGLSNQKEFFKYYNLNINKDFTNSNVISNDLLKLIQQPH